MRKLTALFVASTLALGAANLAHAADTTTAAPADAKPMMHHKGKFGPHEDMMFKDLNLTDAQKQQIREIMKGQRDQMKVRRWKNAAQCMTSLPAIPSIKQKLKRRSQKWKNSAKLTCWRTWKPRTRFTTS